MTSFRDYMDEVIPNEAFGGTGKRRLVWSEQKKRIAEEVWTDFEQRNGVKEHDARTE